MSLFIKNFGGLKVWLAGLILFSLPMEKIFSENKKLENFDPQQCEKLIDYSYLSPKTIQDKNLGKYSKDDYNVINYFTFDKLFLKDEGFFANEKEKEERLISPKERMKVVRKQPFLTPNPGNLNNLVQTLETDADAKINPEDKKYYLARSMYFYKVSKLGLDKKDYNVLPALRDSFVAGGLVGFTSGTVAGGIWGLATTDEHMKAMGREGKRDFISVFKTMKSLYGNYGQGGFCQNDVKGADMLAKNPETMTDPQLDEVDVSYMKKEMEKIKSCGLMCQDCEKKRDLTPKQKDLLAEWGTQALKGLAKGAVGAAMGGAGQNDQDGQFGQPGQMGPGGQFDQVIDQIGKTDEEEKAPGQGDLCTLVRTEKLKSYCDGTPMMTYDKCKWTIGKDYKTYPFDEIYKAKKEAKKNPTGLAAGKLKDVMKDIGALRFDLLMKEVDQKTGTGDGKCGPGKEAEKTAEHRTRKEVDDIKDETTKTQRLIQSQLMLDQEKIKGAREDIAELQKKIDTAEAFVSAKVLNFNRLSTKKTTETSSTNFCTVYSVKKNIFKRLKTKIKDPKTGKEEEVDVTAHRCINSNLGPKK